LFPVKMRVLPPSSSPPLPSGFGFYFSFHSFLLFSDDFFSPINPFSCLLFPHQAVPLSVSIFSFTHHSFLFSSASLNKYYSSFCSSIQVHVTSVQSLYGTCQRERRGGGVTKRCRLSWLTYSALVYEPKCGGRARGGAGSQPMNTAVHKSPNKLRRSNSLFSL
jgi:hypothetical protein